MKFFKRTDIIVIAAILLISLISWIAYEIYTDDKAIKAEIYYYSELVKTVRLDKPKNYKFSIDQNPNVIFQVDENGGIAFISSDCPDKVCVKTGRLYRIGEYAACLPNGIIIKIVSEGRGNDDVDIIVGN